jgi:hypothetical protein
LLRRLALLRRRRLPRIDRTRRCVLSSAEGPVAPRRQYIHTAHVNYSDPRMR